MMGKARQRKTHMQVFGKLTDLVDAKHGLRENAPFKVRESHAKDGTPIDEVMGIVSRILFSFTR